MLPFSNLPDLGTPIRHPSCDLPALATPQHKSVLELATPTWTQSLHLDAPGLSTHTHWSFRGGRGG